MTMHSAAGLYLRDRAIPIRVDLRKGGRDELGVEPRPWRQTIAVRTALVGRDHPPSLVSVHLNSNSRLSQLDAARHSHWHLKWQLSLMTAGCSQRQDPRPARARPS